MSDALTERVLTIIAAIMALDSSQLSVQTSAKEVAGWDSLKHMRLIMTLENEFKVKFKPQQIIAMENIGAIITYLREQMPPSS
ncbi:MAG: acyl carrier protein [Gammaproteobacteria bacterium]|nr:acyl carrier protein [Gammaproteobacteria bacterium]